MNRLFVPTLGPTDWRRLLADPTNQWERRKSALEMAVCWEAARHSRSGLPPEVAEALDTSEEMRGTELLIGFPEHKVEFIGGNRASQNDLWALLRSGSHLVSMTIEAKAGEPLDEIVRDWLPRDDRPKRKGARESGKPTRLADLQARLGVTGHDVSLIRYQLLHRTASALKEAERFGAGYAVMLVQSFNRLADEQSWQDFVRFGELMAAPVREGAVVRSQRATAVPLFLGWVTSEPADLGRLEAAV